MLGDVPPADEPFVVAFDRQHRYQSDQRGVVGEDADDVGAPADLAVDDARAKFHAPRLSGGYRTSIVASASHPTHGEIVGARADTHPCHKPAAPSFRTEEQS